MPNRRLAIGLSCAAIAIAAGFDVPGMLAALVHRFDDPLPVVEAARVTTGMAYDVHWPERVEPSVVSLGPAPTPVSVAYTVADEHRAHLFLYETTGPMTLATIDRTSGRVEERTVPDGQLTYAARFDRHEPHVLWIATCLAAGLVRYDTRTGDLERVLTLEDDSHVFALDQSDDGTLFLGTYPNHRLLRVGETHGAWTAEEVPVPAERVGERPYLHGLFAAADALFLHYASPGRLVKLTPSTGEAVTLHETDAAFLPFRVDGDHLVVQDAERRLVFDREGRSLAAAPPTTPAVDVAIREGVAVVDGVELSLFPRRRGMQITSLERGPDGRVYGGTYWNTWAFRVDVAGGRVAGLGPLPGGCGEFFTTGHLGGELVIPNYQGAVYRIATGAGSPTLETWLDVPEAHYGLATATLGSRVVVATHPNYEQPGGMLYAADASGAVTVRRELDDTATIGSLAVLDGRLFGGTVRRRGMGLGPPTGEPWQPELLEFDPGTLATRSRIPFGAPGDEVVGLVSLPGGDLLCGTRRRLYRCRIGTGGVDVSVVPSFTHLRRGCDAGLDRLVPYDDETVLLLAEDRLLAHRRVPNDVVHVARFATAFERAAVDGEGHLVLSRESQLSVLRAGRLHELLSAAGASKEP